MTMTTTMTTIFDKTAKGRDEIATRQHHVATRLRTLLLLVDGKRDVVDLMAKVAGLGLDEKSLEELIAGEFIHSIEVASGAALVQQAPVVPPPPPPPAPIAPAIHVVPPSPVAVAPAHRADADTAITTDILSAPGGPAAHSGNVVPHGAVSDSTTDRKVSAGDSRLRAGESQFQALTNFFNETIRSTIGLRGFTMQLKVERASTIADLRALREPYLEAVLKSKGPELERSLRLRLDQLLSLES